MNIPGLKVHNITTTKIIGIFVSAFIWALCGLPIFMIAYPILSAFIDNPEWFDNYVVEGMILTYLVSLLICIPVTYKRVISRMIKEIYADFGKVYDVKSKAYEDELNKLHSDFHRKEERTGTKAEEQNAEIANLRRSIKTLSCYKEKSNEYQAEIIKLNERFEHQVTKLRAEVELDKGKITCCELELKYKEDRMKRILEDADPSNYSAAFIDLTKVLIPDESPSIFLDPKTDHYDTTPHADYQKKFLDLKFRYDYIIGLYPDLQSCFKMSNDEETLDYSSGGDPIEIILQNAGYDTDKLRSLSYASKSQIALDEYIRRLKSQDEVGRDFENCAAWYLERRGYKVDRYGIRMRQEDLGRDLIAHRKYDKDKSDGIHKVLVVQCKCWKRDKFIRENVIFQLLGTTIAYQQELENTHQYKNIKVIPVMMIPDFSELSNIAKLFCAKTGVKILKIDYDYPRIKCNVRDGKKIYHLPFDRVYNRTKIQDKGERYAWTVAEAESYGFRRSYI